GAAGDAAPGQAGGDRVAAGVEFGIGQRYAIAAVAARAAHGDAIGRIGRQLRQRGGDVAGIGHARIIAAWRALAMRVSRRCTGAAPRDPAAASVPPRLALPWPLPLPCTGPVHGAHAQPQAYDHPSGGNQCPIDRFVRWRSSPGPAMATAVTLHRSCAWRTCSTAGIRPSFRGKSMLYRRLLALAVCAGLALQADAASNLKLNDQGYFEAPGLNVTVFADIYPDGHQTGVTVIQHGERVAANGDLRLEPSPGQWSPVPAGDGKASHDPATGTLTQALRYPDESKDRK